MPTRSANSRKPAPALAPSARGLAYAKAVVAGKIDACRWVRLACQRHLDDLKRSKAKSYPFRFDTTKADKVCRFLELLPHVKGRWAVPDPGRPQSIRIRLEPWQCFGIGALYGWVSKATKLRRFRRGYIEVPRKNGKSIIGGGCGLYGLAADGEYGAEVYSGATSEKQAWEVFRPAKQMAERTPEFLAHYGVQVNAKGIVVPANGSRFEPVIGKPGDGASPSLAIVDEYHEHPDDTLYDTMNTGMGAREQPLMLVITTAGDNIEGPCYALHDQVCRMLDGTQPNDQLFGLIYTIDEADDWTSEAALRKANPNFGVSVGADYLTQQIAEAVQNARKQATVKTKHLNVWVTARDAWMNMEWWNRQADRSLRADQFTGSPCFGGADLSSSLDIASVCRVFRREQADGPIDETTREPTVRPHFYVFWRHYLPEATVEEPENQHYQAWAHEGQLTVIPGAKNDFGQIRADLFADVTAHGMEELAIDEWGGQETLTACDERGLTAIGIPQTTKHLSDPMKQIEALVKSGQLHHAGDPVATWAVANVEVREDANENIFPRKGSPKRKIDPAVALILAMGRALLAQPGSVYDERGLVWLE
ncbi:MAG: terminase TerL endonuclease subunit [Gemmatimonadales bacterium]|nr:terminase TerL endonuclease subunit [Gemmatimonadales bacterium]